MISHWYMILLVVSSLQTNTVALNSTSYLTQAECQTAGKSAQQMFTVDADNIDVKARFVCVEYRVIK